MKQKRNTKINCKKFKKIRKINFINNNIHSNTINFISNKRDISNIKRFDNQILPFEGIQESTEKSISSKCLEAIDDNNLPF